MGLIISAVISFVISMIVWKFIYHRKLAEYEENKIDNYKQAINKLVDLLSNYQAFNLRMVLLHAYCPDCSIEDLYTRVNAEANSNVLKEQLKHQLREVINCPALFLTDKKVLERGIKKAMKQINYNSKEFNKLLDEYFQTNEFKKWADAWFPDVKEDSEED